MSYFLLTPPSAKSAVLPLLILKSLPLSMQLMLQDSFVSQLSHRCNKHVPAATVQQFSLRVLFAFLDPL
jgi:hypothetical protein